MIGPVFRTSRLLLKPMASTDGNRLFPLFSDPAIWWYAPEQRHRSAAQTIDYAARAASRWEADGLSYWVAVLLDDSSQLVGTGGVQLRDDGTWNLNYRISPEHQRMGFAAELGRAALTAANQHSPTRTVFAWIDESNEPSKATATTIGMRRIGSRIDTTDGCIRVVFSDRDDEGRTSGRRGPLRSAPS